MFIKTTVFKRLLKQAYKRDLLQVGHEDNTNIYYIIGGYWAIMVEKRFFTNAAKAALDEHVFAFTGPIHAHGLYGSAGAFNGALPADARLLFLLCSPV